MSHLDFLELIELKKFIGNILKYIFIFIFLMNTFIRFYTFWIFNNIKNIVYFDVLNHCI